MALKRALVVKKFTNPLPMGKTYHIPRRKPQMKIGRRIQPHFPDGAGDFHHATITPPSRHDFPSAPDSSERHS
jgi:hypothetical protein